MFAERPPADPLELFHAWYAEAEASEPINPDAAALATVGSDGMPSVRMVLLKGADERGFVFYTNLASLKGEQLLANPKAALCFYWKSLGRQVRVEGETQQVGDEEADAYFDTRPRQSQLGAWASKQSRPLESRHALEKRVAQVAARYPFGPIPRPPDWSGFRLRPQRIEFWREGRFRLHDRLLYLREAGGWSTRRLYP